MYISTYVHTEICCNVATEPTLQPVMNECFFHCFSNTESGVHFDVRAQGFWGFTINKLILTSVCLIPWLHLIIIPHAHLYLLYIP